MCFVFLIFVNELTIMPSSVSFIFFHPRSLPTRPPYHHHHLVTTPHCLHSLFSTTATATTLPYSSSPHPRPEPSSLHHYRQLSLLYSPLQNVYTPAEQKTPPDLIIKLKFQLSFSSLLKINHRVLSFFLVPTLLQTLLYSLCLQFAHEFILSEELMEIKLE